MYTHLSIANSPVDLHYGNGHGYHGIFNINASLYKAAINSNCIYFITQFHLHTFCCKIEFFQITVWPHLYEHGQTNEMFWHQHGNHLYLSQQVHLIVCCLLEIREGVSLEGEVPDKAGVRVIRRGRAAVGSRHYSLTAVATVHITIGLHVVAVEHIWTCKKGAIK